jgi:adenylate kinase family enzyme
MRLLIAGVPRAGKTTLANRLEASRLRVDAVPWTSHGIMFHGCVLHTDEFIGRMTWSDTSRTVAEIFDEIAAHGPWTIEGVAVVRGLRKWLATHHSGTPCDEILWLGTPRVPLTSGQAAMAKACETVWDEVRPELERRGVRIVGG